MLFSHARLEKLAAKLLSLGKACSILIAHMGANSTQKYCYTALCQKILAPQAYCPHYHHEVDGEQGVSRAFSAVTFSHFLAINGICAFLVPDTVLDS